MADLFGPIMAPYAALQQQSNDYRRRLEHIAYRRYMTMQSHLSEHDVQRKWKRTFKVYIHIFTGQNIYNHSLLYSIRLSTISVLYVIKISNYIKVNV
jgi:hypothetical protein